MKSRLNGAEEATRKVDGTPMAQVGPTGAETASKTERRTPTDTAKRILDTLDAMVNFLNMQIHTTLMAL